MSTEISTNSIDHAKDMLRQSQRRALSESPAARLHALGERVCARALAFPGFTSAGRVALFASMGREIPTQRLIDHAMKGGKALALPAWVPDQQCYRFCALHADTRLVPGPLGIVQPESGETLLASQFDLVFVPGLAFDLKGGRLGHGRGHYDRLLASARDDARVCKVGLAYEFQKVELIPMDENDVRMDVLLTEENEYPLTCSPCAMKHAGGS